MMKKNLLLLLASMLLLSGCAKEVVYTPTHGGKYIPTAEEESGGGSEDPSGGGGGGQEEEEDVLMCTYNFYFSYSHSTKYNPATRKDEDSPLLSFTAPMLSPLGACPEEVDSKEKVLALGSSKGFSVDPTFPDFLGFSFNGVCLDDENGLWDFTKDYKQLAVVSLYGIWVSNE